MKQKINMMKYLYICKYINVQNTYRETKALLNDSIKKKIESEKILMIKYMKLLNEKKDSVIRINKVSDEDNRIYIIYMNCY